LTLVVFGERVRKKRSDLVKMYDLGGLDDERIIKVAQKEMAADQRLREAKEQADQRLPSQQSPSGASGVDPAQAIDQSPEPRPDDADER
jgi:hypothetical protein